MNKPTVYVVGSEKWNVRKDRKVTERVTVEKVAVRVRKGLPGAGQFHGATNFKTR